MNKPGRRRSLPRRIFWILGLLIILVIAGIIVARQVYDRGLRAVSGNPQSQIFTVQKGSSVKQIAGNLQTKHLIRSAWAFQLYVHNKELTDKLQAGTYALSPSQDVPSIVKTLTKGRVTSELVTILPGRRIDQVRNDLINYGFTPADVDKALDPAQYADLPALAFKPASINSLEGLLWPNSYQKDETTSPSFIIRESLVEMGQHLTPAVQAAFAAQGLSTYDGIKLTSIILQEVNRSTDQPQAAQVFMSRLKNGIKLDSDATSKYGAIAAGLSPSLTYDSAYNTYLHPGLPIGPISSIDAPSLDAATHPALTDWLFFVSGDDGTTYFSRTLEEHEALTKQHCHKLCNN